MNQGHVGVRKQHWATRLHRMGPDKPDVLRARGQVAGPVGLSFPAYTGTLLPQAAPGPDQG